MGSGSGREGSRPALSRVAAAGGFARLIGGDWPASYESQVRSGYAENPVAQRAVKLVMNAVAEAPLDPCDPAAAALVGARSGGQPLLATVAAHLLLHGNAYVQLLRDADGGVAELFALRPERVGANRWRLGDLWRGRRGTEWACAAHAADERFVLLEPDALVAIPLTLANIGATARVLAAGVGDIAGPAEAMCPVDGASVAPPAPSALRWEASADGGAVVRWTRRSRAGWRWADGGDAPLGEEAELYRVTIGDRETVVDVPAAVLTPENRAAPVAVTVRQLGTLAASRPTAITIPAA